MTDQDDKDELEKELEDIQEELDKGLTEEQKEAAFDFDDAGVEDVMSQQWKEAHEKYENGDKEMMGRMIEGLSNSHALQSIKAYNGAFSKKGKYLDYDEWHTFSAAVGLIGLSYVWHPVTLALFLLITKKIIDHSYANVKNADCQHHYETLDVFGKELWYFIGGALGSAWFFEQFTQYNLDLSQGGTSIQLILEFSKLFLGL